MNQHNPRWPLYQDVQILEPKYDLLKSHPGLWFERFFHQYQQNWTVPDGGKQAFIQELVGTSNRASCGNTDQLTNYTDRQKSLVQDLKGFCRFYTNDWHWVTGLGLPSPLENGFIWHPTLATPYLPGSSVKGLVRAWLESESETGPAHIKRWFGSPDKSTDKTANFQSGELIFFDAIPIEPVTLALDVMTPHGGKWYSDGDRAEVDSPETVPADWNSPVPVPFMVVRQSTLLFSIAPRPGCTWTEDEQQLFKTALNEALAWLGAGAKTAIGYGYMQPDKFENKHFEEEAQQRLEDQENATLSEERKTLKTLRQMLEQQISNRQPYDPNGPLRKQLKQAISVAENWLPQDRQDLKAITEECIRYWDPKKKNNKLKDLKRLVEDW